jgi:hypothetical protein
MPENNDTIETTESTCVQCGGDVKTCGPMVKGLHFGPDYRGLRHLPNVGERRTFRS